jgi:hypothetical protein
MSRATWISIVGVVVGVGSVAVALLYPTTCHFPAAYSFPSTFKGICNAHASLRIGIAVAGVVIGLILVAVASRREPVSA